MNQDEQHLQLLSIFHYVVGGIAAVFAMFPILHLILGVAVLTGKLQEGGNPPPQEVGWLLVALPGCFILTGLALATCIVIAGRRISQRRSHMFCLVVAAVECCFMPFGTALGIFTIIVLIRPEVKRMFGVETAQQSVGSYE